MQAFGIGIVGRDAEIRTTSNDQSVVNLSLAFSYGRKDSEGKRQTQWVDAALWGKRAEAMCDYLTKGTKIMVTLDDVHLKSFEKNDGTTSTKLCGTISAIEFVGGPKKASSDDEPAPKQAPRPAPKPAARRPSGDLDDDDIPF